MLFFHFKIFSTFQKAFLCVHTLKPHDTYGSLSVMVRICLGDSLTFCWNQPHVYQFRSHMWRPCTGQLEPTKRSKENICHPTSTYRCGYVARCVPNNPCLWGPMICTVKYLIIAFSFAYFCVCSCIFCIFSYILVYCIYPPPQIFTERHVVLPTWGHVSLPQDAAKSGISPWYRAPSGWNQRLKHPVACSPVGSPGEIRRPWY